MKCRVSYSKASTSCTRWLLRFFSSTSVGVRGFWSINRPDAGDKDFSVALLIRVELATSADRGLARDTETERAMPTVAVGDRVWDCCLELGVWSAERGASSTVWALNFFVRSSSIGADEGAWSMAWVVVG
jgi:hypothetical protein